MEDRRQMILDELEEKGKVRVAELSQKFGCSEMTIRTDIRALQSKGLLHRVHGGAEKIEAEPAEQQQTLRYTAESLYRNADKKRQIAKCAYRYIEPYDTIILDDASSSFYLAEYIKLHADKHLAVVTNSLPIGNELSGLDHIDLYMIGGHVSGRLPATMGDAAVESIYSFHADKAFIGVHGINFDAGLTSIATPQMQIKHAILKSSEKIFVLADSSKFGGGYLSVICPIERVDMIITDTGVSAENLEKAQMKNVNLVIARG